MDRINTGLPSQRSNGWTGEMQAPPGKGTAAQRPWASRQISLGLCGWILIIPTCGRAVGLGVACQLPGPALRGHGLLMGIWVLA